LETQAKDFRVVLVGQWSEKQTSAVAYRRLALVLEGKDIYYQKE
jgi:hypothetical protein